MATDETKEFRQKVLASLTKLETEVADVKARVTKLEQAPPPETEDDED